MEAAPAATEEKPVAKPESNQQDDDSDSFVSPSFGGFKNPYADEELEEKPEKKPEAKDTEKKLLSLKWLLSPTKAAMSFWVSAV